MGKKGVLPKIARFFRQTQGLFFWEGRPESPDLLFLLDVPVKKKAGPGPPPRRRKK